MLGVFHLFLHVLIYAGAGIMLYSLRSRLYLVPFCIYVGVLQVFTSQMNGVYILDVGWGIQIGGGNIAYAAVMWSVALTYIMERDIPSVKMFIMGIISVQFVFFMTYPYFSFLLGEGGATSPLSIPGQFFDISFWIFLIGNILSISEMVVMIYLLERMRLWFSKMPALLDVIIVYVGILLIDSVLFPLLAYIPTQSTSIVQGAAAFYGKVLLGIFYSTMMIVATRILQSRYLTEKNSRDVRLAEILTLPKTEVIKAWLKAEENHNMVKILLDLLSHDIRNYNNAGLMTIELITETHPQLDEKLRQLLYEIRGIEMQSIDLVDNIMTLGMIEENILRPEEVNVLSLFRTAVQRIRVVYSNIQLKVINEEVLDINVRCHPILQHVLYNILSNIVKYRRPQHEVAIVECNTYEETDGIHVILADRGVGMPDEEKRRAFDSLQKRPRRRGFGLYLVWAILNQLGCGIRLENRSDSPNDYTAGTAFHLIFPRRVHHHCG